MNIQHDSTIDELRAQVATLRADFAKLSTTAADGVGDSIGAAARQAAKSGREAKATVVDAVLANPLASLGVAAGIGYLLGVFTRR